jgi:hypothetical protein
MAPLGCEAQVETHLSLFGDSANLNARYVQSLGQTYGLGNHYGHSGWNS